MAIKIKGKTDTKRVVDANGDDDWEDAPTELTRRAIFLDVYGDTGSGRTRFSLTAPKPIGLAHAAEKIDGLVQNAARSGTVKLLNFGGVFTGRDEDIMTQAQPIWDRLVRNWISAQQQGRFARSLVMDTATEAWELARLAEFGTLKPKGRIDNLYGRINAEWRSLFKSVRMPDAHCTIITTHQTQDEYVERKTASGTASVRTGDTIRKGQKEIPFLADVIVRTIKRTKKDGTSVFSVVIEKGWYNAEVEGSELEGEDATFANVMSLITGTDPGEWE